jgi:predicted nuclease with TOPRIM domain
MSTEQIQCLLNFGGIRDQFKLLEQKTESLVEAVKALKQENADLAENLQVREEKSDNLSKRLAGLKAESERGRKRIVTLLDKLDMTLEPFKEEAPEAESNKDNLGA